MRKNFFIRLAVILGILISITACDAYYFGSDKETLWKKAFKENGPSSYTTLTANIWSNYDKWFKFTATASTQYIHVRNGSISVYDSSGNYISSNTSSYSLYKYTMTNGYVYYINVGGSSDNFQIAFNDFFIPPENNVTILTADTWADGNITSSRGEQWFKFIATISSDQYIHVNFGTLRDLYVQMYNSDGYEVGSKTNLYKSTTYISRQVTNGHEYYIKITPSYSSDSGTYQIAFNTSNILPLTNNVTMLTANTWASGNLSSYSKQWFKFTATTSGDQYIHISFGTLSYLSVQMYDSSYNTFGSKSALNSSTNYISIPVTIGQEYYIELTSYSSYTDTYSSGTYSIVFNTSSTPPIMFPTTGVTILTANTWVDGSLGSTRNEQWFKFTATISGDQYIHVSFGTLNNLDVQMYDSDGYEVGIKTNLYSSNTYISRQVTNGHEYYIKITPSYSSYSGTYKIAFNTSSTPPS